MKANEYTAFEYFRSLRRGGSAALLQITECHLNARMPQRPASHQLEEASLRHLSLLLPAAWTLERVQHDYGYDARIEIFDARGAATGLEFLVQLKSSQKARENEWLEIKSTTYAYLKRKLQVVLFIKFVSDEQKAYWTFLRESSAPKVGAAKVRVKLSKQNVLDADTWQHIRAVVQQVTDGKLNANE